ncbi:MAG: 23S rRNA (adenine(2503)-C(2))-methyltransferase RlmN [Bacteroidetes bacterium]|jgi:23S rRNA (adenine2503-C2)-methyltransferase|nr:23S rRNA (adenine(2503)-C(2))-methyltransferase RlmN [Bacteroidota bacterium]
METKRDTTATEVEDLKNLNREQLSDFLENLGLQSYRADQVFQWLYQKGAATFEEMTNLSKDLRAQLPEIAEIKTIREFSRQESKDGTVKFLFELDDPNQYKIEAVLIPDFYDDGTVNRLTVCVSSQVGCMFGCSFCATGKMGYFRNLTHGEIVDQVRMINDFAEERFGKKITNIVYMGMGEPLHNYHAVTESVRIITDPLGLEMAARRITISTVGLSKQIKQLADEDLGTNLAISLHAADDKKRNEIMPINESLNLASLKEALTYYFRETHSPITYEYLLFNHFNDTMEDADKLAEIVRWVPSKVNIIMYNNVQGVELQRVNEERLNRFMKRLISKDVTATVRRSRGDDIDAGCGQLAVKEGSVKGKSIVKEKA